MSPLQPCSSPAVCQHAGAYCVQMGKGLQSRQVQAVYLACHTDTADAAVDGKGQEHKAYMH